MVFDKSHALINLAAGSSWAIEDDVLIWLEDGTNPPSEDEIQAEITRLQSEYDALEYARLRKAEYLQLNQFEMQFDDAVNGTTTWVDAINAIKAKYPKP